jgi:hypothetical protein
MKEHSENVVHWTKVLVSFHKLEDVAQKELPIMGHFGSTLTARKLGIGAVAERQQDTFI